MQPGDTMTVAVTARNAGRLTLNVVGDRLLASQTADVQPGVVQVKLPVGRDWGTGAYLVATLRRPLDAPAQRMPGRAIGVQWFSIDRARKDAQRRLASRRRCCVRIRRCTSRSKSPGLAPATRRAWLLPPSMSAFSISPTTSRRRRTIIISASRRLSAEIRDLYGELIDGMQGARGQIRSGGDEGAELQGSPPTGPPVALYSGLVKVGADGSADVAFDIPDFAGTIRVMAVAWSKDKVGHASTDVTVRDPVVLSATLPRFLLPGDRSSVHLDLDNVEGQAGDYTIAVTSADALSANATQKLTLRAKERGAANVPLSATAAGAGTVRVKVSGPGGFALERTFALTVRSPAQILARRTIKPLAKGESVTLSSDIFADLVPGTGAVSVSVGSLAAFDAAGLLAALDRYPYRCSEQITSRALPLLYVSDLAKEAQVAVDPATDQRIRDAIEALLTRQDSTARLGFGA